MTESPTTAEIRDLIGQDVTMTTVDGGTYLGRLTVSDEGDAAALADDGFFFVGDSRGIARSNIATLTAQ